MRNNSISSQIIQLSMKQSGVKGQISSSNKHNLTRLINQNRHLYTQIQRLKLIINNVIERNASLDYTSVEEEAQLSRKHNEQQQPQLREIRKLKQQIKAIRATFAEHKYSQIKHQEDELICLKREHQKLSDEKATLSQMKLEKTSALVYYQPLNQQTSQTYQHYKKVKAQNGELKSRIHELEREVSKYHTVKQLSKRYPLTHSQISLHELSQLQKDIINLKQETKKIQEKWRPKIDALDREYFSLKTVLAAKEKSVVELQKSVRDCENKSHSFRDENRIASDRLRVRSLVVSPKKKEEILKITKELIHKSKASFEKTNRVKPKKEKADSKSDKEQISSGNSEHFSSEKPVEKQPKTKNEEVSVGLSQIEEAEKLKSKQTKPKKNIASVGVGTSFYYEAD